jgi:L,D-peptidoglycan transpeptidase YkuD (ErfK/YbiS/YcfS/YnhG family)
MILGMTFAFAVGFGGCTDVRPAVQEKCSDITVARAIDGGTIAAGQLLVVIAEEDQTSRAKLYAMNRGNHGWQLRGGGIPAMIGRHGFAQPGKKREGDGHTPAGLFRLESVFGYAPSVTTRMPYRQATKDDVWVDDVNAPDYNSWQKRGETKASSFEEMRRNDHYYRLGAVIGYNRQPAVKGHGSAIFLHVWRGDGKPTSGCVAIDEQELAGIIGWLDPAKRPMILMGIRSDLLNGSEKRPSLEK